MDGEVDRRHDPPFLSQTGTAIERSPYASSSLLTATPAVANALSSATSALFVVIVLARGP